MAWLILGAFGVSFLLCLANAARFLYRRGSSLAPEKRRIHRIGLAFFVACVINLVLFMGVALFLGGSADFTGGAQNGRYYLSNHGIRTEVSRTIYTYSRVHLISLPITGIIGTLGFLSMLRAERKAGNPPL
jgi:hypothetical protein